SLDGSLRPADDDDMGATGGHPQGPGYARPLLVPGWYLTARSGSLDGVVAELTRADPHEALDRHGPELAVPDLPGPGRRSDDVHDLLHLRRLDEDLDLDLGHEVDLVLRATEHLALAALAAVTLHLR